MLGQTRGRLEDAGLTAEVEVIEGSGLELPFADESFDLIVNGYMLDPLPATTSLAPWPSSSRCCDPAAGSSSRT